MGGWEQQKNKQKIMSTRAAIARLTGQEKPEFKGVYHHWDGYCSALGATLYALYQGHFNKDLGLMLETLIDKHPAGWSTINGADFNLEPGWSDDYESKNPKCFCHGDRDEEPMEVTNENASGMGCEYVYVFDEQKKTMTVLSSYCPDGEKMIGMFGMGDEQATWHSMAVVDLNREEPDWTEIEG